MIITLGDWQFRIHKEATLAYTRKCSLDHCTCPYCKNFYDNIDAVYPQLRPVLDHFGIFLNGPCEVMPVEPAWIIACYRVTGEILNQGVSRLHADGVDLRPEPGDKETFLLWIGPVELPWTQPEDMNEVISPANQPEFMDRMMQRLLLWADDPQIDS